MKFIKTLVVGMLLVGLMGAVIEMKYNQPLEVIKIEKEEVVEVPEWQTDDEAIKAAQAVIDRKRDEAELKAVQGQIEALRARETELEKSLGSYWREVSNLKQEVRKVASEYGVSAYAMEAIIGCESGWNTSIQSRHTYTAKNVPKGYQVGDREESYGLVQIHIPVHNVTKEQAIDPEFAIEFMAKNIADGRIGMWTCSRTVAMI